MRAGIRQLDVTGVVPAPEEGAEELAVGPMQSEESCGSPRHRRAGSEDSSSPTASSSLSHRRMVPIEPLKKAFCRTKSCASMASNSREHGSSGPVVLRSMSTIVAGDVNSLQESPTFRCLSRQGDRSKSHTMPLTMPLTLESEPSTSTWEDTASTATCSGHASFGCGLPQQLLAEQRELRRQMEEWVKQLLHNQERILQEQGAPRAGGSPAAAATQPPAPRFPEAAPPAKEPARLLLPSVAEPEFERGVSAASELSMASMDGNTPKAGGHKLWEDDKSAPWASKRSGSRSKVLAAGVSNEKLYSSEGEKDEDNKADTPASRSRFGRRGSVSDLLMSKMADMSENNSITRTASMSFGSIETIPPRWRVCLSSLIQSKLFTVFTVVMIAVNTIVVGVEMDTNAKVQASRLRGDVEIHGSESLVGLGFTLVFAVEMTLRLLAEGRQFFRGPLSQWNISDLVLVSVGFLEQMLKAFFGHDSAAVMVPNVTAGRILRVISLLRALNIHFLVRTMHSMRLMLFLILGSVTQLLRALVIIFFVMYIFSLVFLYGVEQYFEQAHVDRALSDDPHVVFIETNFGSFARICLTLFMSISGGCDWGIFWEGAAQLGTFYGGLFVFYVAFVVIGVLNVVTGVFVDSAWQMAQADRDNVVHDQMAQKEAFMSELRQLFFEADTDGSGSLSWDEFKDHLRDERVNAYLSSLELDMTQARGLFKLLDTSGKDEVTIDDFVSGCMRLKGLAKSIDLCTLLYENRKLARSVATQFSNLRSTVARMDKKLVGTRSTLRDLHERSLTLPTILLDAERARSAAEIGPLAGPQANSHTRFGVANSGQRSSSGSRPSSPRVTAEPFAAAGGFGPWAENDDQKENENSDFDM